MPSCGKATICNSQMSLHLLLHLQHGAQRHQLRVADIHVRADEERALRHLPLDRLGGAALHVLDGSAWACARSRFGCPRSTCRSGCGAAGPRSARRPDARGSRSAAATPAARPRRSRGPPSLDRRRDPREDAALDADIGRALAPRQSRVPQHQIERHSFTSSDATAICSTNLALSSDGVSPTPCRSALSPLAPQERGRG